MNTARYNITATATLLFALAVNILFMSYVPGVKKNSPAVTSKGFAVVELFTSEGCSSCPAADALLGKISKEYKDNVFVLGFHVDYWNTLGWKDAFSDETYSERQQQYGTVFHLKSIYTPQAVINGATECTGSDEDKLRAAIAKQLTHAGASAITLTAKSEDGKTVTVVYNTLNAGDAVINVALVQSHATTAVKRGENEGHVLNHVNVVRTIKTVAVTSNTTSKVTLSIPPGLTVKDCKVIAYTQDKKTLQVTAAAGTGIQ